MIRGRLVVALSEAGAAHRSPASLEGLAGSLPPQIQLPVGPSFSPTAGRGQVLGSAGPWLAVLGVTDERFPKQD
jgi:hypothetical protein